MATSSSSAQEVIEKTFNEREFSSIKVNNSNGAIQITGNLNEKTTVIKISHMPEFSSSCDLVVNDDNDQLSVAVVAKEKPRALDACKSSISITTGKKVDLDLQTPYGKITASGITGKIRISNISGAIAVEGGAISDLIVNSASGDLLANGLIGNTDIQTLDSHVTLYYNEITNPCTASIKTVSGNATVYLSSKAAMNHLFQSITGEMNSEIKPTPNASLTIKMGSIKGSLNIKKDPR